MRSLKLILQTGVFRDVVSVSELRFVIRTYENESDEHDSASIWCDDTSTHIHCRIFFVPISWQIWGLKLWRAFKRRVGTTTDSALGGVWHHTKSDETDAEFEVESCWRELVCIYFLFIMYGRIYVCLIRFCLLCLPEETIAPEPAGRRVWHLESGRPLVHWIFKEKKKPSKLEKSGGRRILHRWEPKRISLFLIGWNGAL